LDVANFGSKTIQKFLARLLCSWFQATKTLRDVIIARLAKAAWDSAQSLGR